MTENTYKSNSYGNDDIEQLEGENRIRTRPESMLGSSGIDGARHGLTEIVGNAVDEHSSGYGDKIDITYYEDHSVSVRDYGRGVPIGWNEKVEKWNWFLIFAELYSGGKYKDYQDILLDIDKKGAWENFNPHDLNYFFSIGLNGLGAASTQYTSSFFVVHSYRNGVCSTMKFEHGRPVSELTEEETTEPNGTFIHWKPDSQVFSEVNMGSQFLEDISNTVAYVSGVSVHLVDHIKGSDRLIPAGSIKDMLKAKYNLDHTPRWHTKQLHHGHTEIKERDCIYVLEDEIVFDIVPSGGEITAHHNGVLMRGTDVRNSHHIGIYYALETFFKRVSKDYEVRIKVSDYIDRFAFVVNGYSNVASYRGQTKDFVDDLFISSSIAQDVQNIIEMEYDKSNEHLIKLIEEIIEEIEVKKQLEEQRKIVKQAVQKSNSKKSNSRRNIKKFDPSRDYINNKVSGTQLFIVEGDSAQTSAKSGRNSTTQSVYPIRGKIINAEKNSVVDVLNNSEVSDLIQIIGGGIELPEADQYFNIDSVKFEDIVILTDADKDGYQIRSLLMVFFNKFMPQIIEEGRLFIAESPIIELDYGNRDFKYAYNLDEYSKIMEEYGKPVHSTRFKGLAGLSPRVLSDTTLNINKTKRKNLIPICFDTKDPLLYSMIDALLGKDVAKQRKNIITNYLGSDVASMFEENEELFNELADIDDELDTLDV